MGPRLRDRNGRSSGEGRIGCRAGLRAKLESRTGWQLRFGDDDGGLFEEVFPTVDMLLRADEDA